MVNKEELPSYAKNIEEKESGNDIKMFKARGKNIENISISKVGKLMK